MKGESGVSRVDPTGGWSAWAPLKEPLFRSLWAANLISNIGGWMQAVGAAWLMTSLSSSPLMVTMVQASSSLPIVLLALPAGALADIADRRRILLFSQFWMMTAAAALTYLVFKGAISPILLLALTGALGIGTALMGPAAQAVITELVPSSQLGSAVSLNSVGFNLARAVGPALGGIILAQTGAGYTFLLNSVSFLVVILVLYRWRPGSRKSVLPAERFVGAIRGGVRYVRNAPALQSVLLRTGSFVIFGSALWALLPLVVRNELARGPSAYGMTLGALGAGALIGAVLLPRLKSRFSLEILVDCNIALFGAVSIGTALVHSYSLLLIVLLAGGIAWITLLSQLNLAARSVVPAWIEARALASYLLVFQGGTAIGSLVWGAIAAKMGLRFSLVCAGAGLFLNLLLVFRYSMSRVAAVNAAPAGNWPAPPPLDDSFSANAPALVTIKYQVKETRSQDFATAMYELEVSRRRDGALYWGLFADPAESGLYIEQFLVESWTEHLRQHERTTVDDRMLQDAIRSMLSGAELPLVDHYIAHEHFSHTKRT